MHQIGAHYRPTDGNHDPGTYRVVGAPDDVALLRVADGDGQRVHTGHLVHVRPDVLDDEFAAADDPDAGFQPAGWARNLLQGTYWQVRRFF